VSAGELLLDIASDRQTPGWPHGGAATTVLIEAPGMVERRITTMLRSAGYDVGQCEGPGCWRRAPCPLLAAGHCRLADHPPSFTPNLQAAIATLPTSGHALRA
jgi:hypothetical protein